MNSLRKLYCIILLMAGLNHGYSQEMMDDAESSAPCVHQLELQYFCSPDDISYTDLACIGVTSSNGQVFISETWKQEEILSFKEYTTQEKDKLTFTKDMLPLTLLIEPISRVQPIWILKEMLNSIFENIPFNTLKRWGSDPLLIAELKESDLFNEDGTLKNHHLCIYSPAPSSPQTVLFLHNQP